MLLAAVTRRFLLDLRTTCAYVVFELANLLLFLEREPQ